MPATPLSPNAEASVKTLREALSHPGAKLGNLARRIETAARDLQEGVTQWGSATLQSKVLGHDVTTEIRVRAVLVIETSLRETGREGVIRQHRIEVRPSDFPIAEGVVRYENNEPPVIPARTASPRPSRAPAVGSVIDLREANSLPIMRRVRVTGHPSLMEVQDAVPEGFLIYVDGTNEDVGTEEGWTDELLPGMENGQVWAISVEDLPFPGDGGVVTHGPVPGDF